MIHDTMKDEFLTKATATSQKHQRVLCWFKVYIWFVLRVTLFCIYSFMLRNVECGRMKSEKQTKFVRGGVQTVSKADYTDAVTQRQKSEVSQSACCIVVFYKSQFPKTTQPCANSYIIKNVLLMAQNSRTATSNQLLSTAASTSCSFMEV